MIFYTDTQTLKDLSIFGKNKKITIYGLFDKTRTNGGAKLLESMFKEPLSDLAEIQKRIDVIRYLHDQKKDFPFTGSLINNVTEYMQNVSEQGNLDLEVVSIKGKLKRRSGLDLDYKRDQEGIMLMIRLIHLVRDFIDQEKNDSDSSPFQAALKEMREIIDDKRLDWVAQESGEKTFGYEKTAACDSVFRYRARDILLRLLTHLYVYDAYIAVAKTARERGFSFPTPLPREDNRINIKELYHPFIDNPVPNDIEIDPSKQIIFLTGANMAGKSTFMKSFGLCIYLAHMGFPVPAESMEFSIRGGLYTTINLPDQLQQGYSHFYTEVQRVKKVAELLSRQHDLIIIFDELFRGTNVKDAYDGTLAVTEAFADYQKAIFMISTHITEVGEALQKGHDNILYTYIVTLMNGETPVFTRKLKEGISEDRFGMKIINNERIIETIRGEIEVTPSAKEEEKGVFFVDKQTARDLELFGKFREETILKIFDQTITQGGHQTLELMFMNPRTNEQEIQKRNSIIRYFQQINQKFPLTNTLMKDIDVYLNISIPRFRLLSLFSIIKWRLFKYFLDDAKFDFVKDGIDSCIKMFELLDKFSQTWDNTSPVYQEERTRLQTILASPKISWWRKMQKKKQLSYFNLAHLDYILRRKVTPELKELQKIVSGMDAYISIAKVAKEKGFTFAIPHEGNRNFVRIEELYHPNLENPVANSIQIDSDQNMFFLTGANMAGKSTFMKAFGVAVYLAHAGFPVPAKYMEFSIQEGMYTSINLADDLTLGYSHFFSEVLRVKTVAEKLNKGKRFVLIMDELFKGTNVKDAYDATVAVSSAFADAKNSLFLISTHIIETAYDLQKGHQNVQFFYFPTEIEDNKPIYPYLLKSGVTSDRHGMRIINNEQIVETITNSH